ncbi:MAG: Coenzyme F420 hydrogenase/dehydrogenase, beta subunit C-terminal domain [Deferribacteraceae bacterium]|jgi:coenzyme F420 hydrogenase subunit beta|nr:Coenzyme F420 hydrogenase/dehydrogenase, beta subunit C-terminal domain [Deferribacteraceae bacterium]
MNSASYLKEYVIESELCTRCGTCIGVCPCKVFTFQDDEIQTNEASCIDCGLCKKTCPGVDFDFLRYANNGDIQSRYFGHYRSIIKGRSKCEGVCGASGGVVTTILIHLLNSKQINGALVVSSYNGLGFEPIIADNEALINDSAQSKYCLIPMNKLLADVKKKEGQFAFVGLPCQVHGLRKAMEFDPILKKKINLIIGLFCGFNMYYEATDYLISQSKIPEKNIKNVEYRSKVGDNTGFCVTSLDGTRFFTSKSEYAFLNMVFVPRRCLKCYDYSAEFADLSVGDAWELKNASRVILRSIKAENIISDLVKEKLVDIFESSEYEILKKQKKIIDNKKLYIWERFKYFKHKPQYNVAPIPLNGKEKIGAFIFNSAVLLGTSKFAKLVLRIVPYRFITVLLNKKR